MNLSHKTVSLLVLVVLVAFAPLQARAIPFPWHNAGDKVDTPLQSPYGQNNLPQFKWLRDTIVQKLFGVSASTKGSLQKPGRPLNSLLPSTLSAKYGGDVVLRFNLSTPEEERMLAEAADTLFLDVWEFTNNWADIRMPEEDVPSLLKLLPNSLKMAYSNLMPNLANTISQSYPSITFASDITLPQTIKNAFTPLLKNSGGVDNLFFSEYQPLSVIVPWMRLMASMFTSHVRMINIGTSYEGRDIPALRIGVSPNLASFEPRKTIIISGGLHAREWVSVSTVTYIAWSLITLYGKSPGITKLLQEFDFVLIPTVNPDGYVYTWETDRLWRKNRQQTNLRFCRGVDLDRAFGFEWDGNTAQANPCSESYQGEKPFQAVEAHRLAEWAKNETENNNVHFVGFLDFHSYSQQVLYPYSYSCNDNPPSLENLEELGMGLAKAIRISSGEQYGVASACEGAVSSNFSTNGGFSRMETGGGSAIDWFYHELKVRYSYQVKLRDTGSYGFLLPKEDIVPTGDEAFNAVKYFGDFLLGNKGIETTIFPELHVEEANSEVTPETQSSSTDEDEGSSEATSETQPNSTDEDEAVYEFEANMELRRRR